MIRILQITRPAEIRQLMRDIKVDSFGIDIMFPKAVSHLIRINSLPCIAANILKQEMLSLGGDVAVSRDALTGRAKNTDSLLIGNLSQFNNLKHKLNKQPFGLNRIASDLSRALTNYQKNNFKLTLGRYKLNLSRRPHIMGVVNVTPDSFSGDGLLKYKVQSTKYKAGGVKYQRLLDHIVNYAKQMVRDGADIIDVGGESSRPGAKPVSVKEELSRTIPVIKILAGKINAPISIDTYKPEVAKQALDNGAVMVNDITGLRNRQMINVVSRQKAGVVIMHMKGTPRNMQKNPVYGSLMDDIAEYLSASIGRALDAGIDKEKIVIDPGIGFGKTIGDNLQILRHLKEFKVLGFPLLIGVSRKSFIGKLLGAEIQNRLFGTIASSVLAVNNGASIVRAHDVSELKQALKVASVL